MKEIFTKKNIVAMAVIVVITVLLEVFVFNFSTFRSYDVEPMVIASDVRTDETGEFYTEPVVIDGTVKNVFIRQNTDYYDEAYASVILTDEGDKYEYSTPEFTIVNNIDSTGFVNIYPFGKVHTIQVAVRANEGTTSSIESITINAHRPLNIKIIRVLITLLTLAAVYLVWGQSKMYDIYFDDRKHWQKLVIAAVVILLMIIGKKIVDSNLLLKSSPWPHHMQYQELARNLKNGTVELTGQVVDPKLLEADNPYDTIALQVEGVSYSMDYAFYNGKYYAYFGIVPEVLFFYPHYLITGNDLSNSRVILYMYMIFILGVFLLSYEWTKRYRNSVPFFFWLLTTISFTVMANFVYLASKPDIYNIPVLSAAAWTVMGIGLWLLGLNAKHKAVRLTGIALGSLSMALVAGCRPQQLLISGLAVIIFMFEDGIKNRKLFTKKSVLETIAFIVPYALVAVLVCWYNFARFGNIFDFGATYSLTTNDMNHRGFNFDRLFRGLYSFFIQPANLSTDYPFLLPSNVDGNYMGRYLSEFTFGGMLVSNGFLYSIFIAVVVGIKKIDKKTKALIIYLLAVACVIGVFDINGAGVLYRYTCDIATALGLASFGLWTAYLDRGKVVTEYKMISRFALICMILGIAYSVLTFIAGDNSISLINANRTLFYEIAQYFRF